MSNVTRSPCGSNGRLRSPLASSHTLFESFCGLTDNEYCHAASFIASLVGPNSSASGAATPGKPHDHLQPHVVDIVFAVIKYMPHLDAILLSSDFLAANPDLVPHLSLVKLLLFQFMATHFASPPVFLLPPDPARGTNPPNAIVRWAADMLVDHKTKLHAAYARLRIAHQASGATDAQRLASLVDWSALKAVEQAPVAFRVRVSPKALLDAITTCLPTWDPREDVVWDKVQDDLIRVPAHLVGELLASPLVKSGGVVVQDACAALPFQFVVDWLVPKVQSLYGNDDGGESKAGNHRKVVVLDTRATHETRLCLYQDYAPALVTYVFPSPISPTFRALATVPNMPWSNSMHLLERSSFLNLDPFDTDSSVSPDIILVEPNNSQSAVLDEKHFLIQERMPKPTRLDEQIMERLIADQVNMLLHALKFTSAKFVLYTTRSTNAAENQHVVETCLAANKDWRLMTVGELDNAGADARDTGKSDSAVFHENEQETDDRDQESMLSDDAVMDGTTWIEIAPGPPNVTCGIFVAVLARRQAVDSELVHEPEAKIVDQELPVASEPAHGAHDPLGQGGEHGNAQQHEHSPHRVRSKRAGKQHAQRFSLRAWRASMRGRDVSGLEVQGSAVEVPLTRQMTALSLGSGRGEGPLRRKSAVFPIVVPWK